MAAITIRLPEPLEKGLEEESQLEKRPRSELIRQALDEFLRRRREARFRADMVRAVRGLDPGESLSLAAEALPLDNEALDLAEVREPARRSRR